MSSETSRTTMAWPCFDAAVLAARMARSRGSVTPRGPLPHSPSTAHVVLPHHDGDVRYPCWLYTNINPTHPQEGCNLIALVHEGRGRRDHLGLVLVEAAHALLGHDPESGRGHAGHHVGGHPFDPHTV